MTKYQKTLLAGVATLAIAAGTGFASAQSPSGGAAGSSGAAGQSPASQSAPNKTPGKSGGQSGGMSQPESGGMSHSGNGSGMQPQAQRQPGSTEEKGKSGSQQNAQGAGTGGRSAEESQKQPGKQQSGKRGAQNGQGAQSGRNKGTAERERTRGGRNQGTAERERTMRGLQGNAAEPMQGAGRANGVGGNVRFTDQQRTTIKRTIIDARGAPRAGHVDFDVRVGTVVPRGSIHVTAVPQTLVRIEPRWRGYLYFVYEDQIVIVNPRDMHIVAVVAV